MERVFCIAIQDDVQPRWICESEDPKAIEANRSEEPMQDEGRAYFGVELGAQTTANDSGSIR